MDTIRALGKPKRSIEAEFAIVGLGNPGRYSGTRHNVGVEVIDILSQRWDIRVRARRFHCRVGVGVIEGKSVLLAKPEVFMNESGRALQSLTNSLTLPLYHLLVICDDMNLPLGKIRLRRSGSHGGHNGLRSIILSLGTNQFPRLRIGIGGMHVPPELWMDFVLGQFASEERVVIDASLQRAADASVDWLKNGIESAMMKFNACSTCE